MREMVLVGEIFITEAKAGQLVFGCKKQYHSLYLCNLKKP